MALLENPRRCDPTAKIIHYPTLGTVLNVEKVLRESDGPISKNEIKRRLKTGIMHQTLNCIINYLEERNMVYVGSKGVSWTFKDDRRLQKRISKAAEM